MNLSRSRRPARLHPYRILDTYAVGQLPQVQLIDCAGVPPSAYKPEKGRDDLRMHFVKHYSDAWCRQAREKT
jgi:hypothetical protein